MYIFCGCVIGGCCACDVFIFPRVGGGAARFAACGAGGGDASRDQSINVTMGAELLIFPLFSAAVAPIGVVV